MSARTVTSSAELLFCDITGSLWPPWSELTSFPIMQEKRQRWRAALEMDADLQV